MFDLQLTTAAITAIIALLIMVIKLRVPAFIALILSCLLLGLTTGMQTQDIINSIKNGMGGTLGFVAVVVGLGAILGQILEASGGIEQIAKVLMNKFGEKNIQWSLGFTGFLVAIPVFFDVAFIILAPLLYGLANKSGRSLLYYASPLLAGLAVTHAFIPPTPGPIAVAEIIGANLGWVIIFGAAAGIPSMIIAGPLFARYIAKRIHVTVPPAHQTDNEQPAQTLSFNLVISLVLLPLVLIMLGTLAPFLFTKDTSLYNTAQFIGHPFVALSLTTVLAMWASAKYCQFNKSQLLNLANKALEPAGIIILITGAGGAFKQILIDSGVGQMLGNSMADSAMPLVLLAFLIAAITRVAQGSSTVAMITAAGLMAPILQLQTLTPAYLGLLVIAISSGATIMSHVNDSGFWLVSRYLGINETDTLKSWTVLTCLIAMVGLTSCLIISGFL